MSIMQEELEKLLQYPYTYEDFQDKTFFITGATGLIGSLLVKSLLYLNKRKKLNLKVTAVVRNIDKARSIFKENMGDSALEFYNHDFGTGQIIYTKDINYIVHSAAVTRSKIMISNPVETFESAVDGTKEILKLAVQKCIKGMVYISSMEVYGQPYSKSKVTEKDLGYVDLTQPRSCYPESKRACELLCTAYSSEYNVPVKIARLAQTFGVGVLPDENRVFMQFAKSAMNKEDIVLHTTGQSEGNYVYTFDAVKAILLLLQKGKNGESYNIANENSHTTIKGMAELVAAEIANNSIKVVIDIPEEDFGYAADVKLFLNSQKITALGWKASVGLVDAYKRMIAYIPDLEQKMLI